MLAITLHHLPKAIIHFVVDGFHLNALVKTCETILFFVTSAILAPTAHLRYRFQKSAIASSNPLGAGDACCWVTGVVAPGV